MLANLLPEYFSLGIPIGLMLGILLAFRKLAISSELDALRGMGIGYGRLLRVPYVYAVGLLLLNLVIVGWLQPWARYGYERLRFELRSGALGASIKVGEFNQLGKRMTLRIDRSEDRGHAASRHFRPGRRQVRHAVAATAEQGRFLSTDDPDTIMFRLTKGPPGPGFAQVRRHRERLTFDSYDLPINLPKRRSVPQARATRAEELTLPELCGDRLCADVSAGTADRRPRRNLPFPPGRSADDVAAAAARGGAGGAAQAKQLGAWHLHRDRDDRRLSQDERICGAGGGARGASIRSSPCGCHAALCRR